MPDRIKKQRFVLLACLFICWFSYPLLSAADKPYRVWGIPVLYLYVFGVWAISVWLLYHTSRRRESENRHDS